MIKRRRVYTEPHAGDWVFPVRRGYRLACCSCGLVHRIDFRLRGRHIELRFFLDNRATAAMRRRLRAPKKEVK